MLRKKMVEGRGQITKQKVRPGDAPPRQRPIDHYL